MKFVISLVFLISFALVQAVPTKEELDDHFIYLGNHGKIE